MIHTALRLVRVFNLIFSPLSSHQWMLGRLPRSSSTVTPHASAHPSPPSPICSSSSEQRQGVPALPYSRSLGLPYSRRWHIPITRDSVPLLSAMRSSVLYLHGFGPFAGTSLSTWLWAIHVVVQHGKSAMSAMHTHGTNCGLLSPLKSLNSSLSNT